jgi:hypothetical protein
MMLEEEQSEFVLGEMFILLDCGCGASFFIPAILQYHCGPLPGIMNALSLMLIWALRSRHWSSCV